MGKLSGRMALIIGLALAGSEAARFLGHRAAWLDLAIALLAAALLCIGGYRTLGKMKGGLRLLSGAWGLTAGLGWTTFFAQLAAHEPAPIALSGAILIASFAGLALTVLHKE